MAKERILVINPGSTSTKIGVFDDLDLLFEKTIRHTTEEIAQYDSVYDQYQFREKLIIDALEENDVELESLTAVIGRGGLLKPIEGGIYEVNDQMLEDLKNATTEHASNIGAVIANEIAGRLGLKSYIADPVVVDELEDIARISGLKDIDRVSIFHALNQKAVAKRYAKSVDKEYEDVNLIVAHMGGGVSVGAHKGGRVIDVSNALDGEGPFSPERSGGIPVGSVVKMCYSGDFSYDEMKKKLTGKGGLVSYLGTSDAREVSERVDKGDKEAEQVYRAMAYQIAKEIGGLSTVLKGDIDAVIFTGGIAYDERFVDWIVERIDFLCNNIVRYPGEDELEALAEAALRVARGEEEAKVYK